MFDGIEEPQQGANLLGHDQTNKEFDMEQFTRTCEHCQEQFWTTWPTQAYCSRFHKEQAREARKRIREGRVRSTYDRTCIGCSAAFTTGRSQQTYCSSDCRDWMTAQRKLDRDREYVNKAKQPAFKRRLYWRDNGICGICQQLIDTNLKYPDPMSFSIDHIIPRSQQGSHSFDNLRPAHLECNSLRGNKPA
jgi:5-methylcytosine-specific restriction endonuclease McrA